jgi:hypothetical protein
MLLKPFHFRKTVTTAGTREQLTTAKLHVPSFTISTEKSNTGDVYIGNNQVSATDCLIELGAGDVHEFEASKYGLAGANWDLTDFWVDVQTSGDGCFVGYAEREDE